MLKNLNFLNSSIQHRIVTQVSVLIALAMSLIIVMVSYLMYDNIESQLKKIIENQASDTKHRIEQRLNYLFDSTNVLAQNELVINSLVDLQSREKVLKLLIKNFMKGKDVLSVSVVDFDGKVIFKTFDNLPKYNSSSQLRNSLALEQTNIYMQDNNVVVISPINYYSTTQGAIIAVFDIQGIARQVVTKKNRNNYVKIYNRDVEVFVHNFKYDTKYYKYKTLHNDSSNMVDSLNLDVELGLEQDDYEKPIKDALIRLSVLGLLFIIAGLFISSILAESITAPILRLYSRVIKSKESKDILCSPIGTNDEVEALAKAFDERTLELQYQVEHDSLTDLPNRVLLLDRINQSIKYAKSSNHNLAVLFIDLDHFKEVNDSLGHSIGDKLLKRVSFLIEEVISSEDTVARLGGDEFVILLNNIESNNDVIKTVQRIMTSFSKVQEISTYKFFISCSIGICMYPDDGLTSEELIKHADAAMYKAKDEGRNNYQFYSKDMTKRAYERLSMEAELREAIRNEDFVVYYQPQMDLISRKIIGVEALVRWMHPKKGMIPPFKFIPIAEDIGLIEDIDKIVMKKAMKEFMELKSKGLSLETLSLNASMIQINGNSFINDFVELISLSGISPKNLILEITETQIMKDVNRTVEILNDIRNLGVMIAVDDFGTGHSSLSYLKKLPINKIKIDQSFIRDIPEDKDDLELARAIIAISKSLNMKVIAEGVETKEQAEFLQNEQCFEAQGYFYYKPIPFNELETELINKQK